jgi:hypothetical protein
VRADSIQGMRAAFPSRILLPKNINIAVRATLVLLVVYGCGTWSVTLDYVRESVQSKISGPRREEVTGDWRRLHNGKLYNL